jgi:dihydrodipicolinate synthase/N-acetylneuraminate lyase
METINIDFKGFIEVAKNDVCLYGIDENTLERQQINKLSTKQIVDGLKDGTYMLNFVESYANAIDGSEEYEFSVAVD